jgi:bifunctional non-homologous end joining protein LigD
MGTYHFGRYKVKTSHEDKTFFPEAGITKGDLIEYYRKIARVMLPYIRERPLMMHRYPDGIAGKDFYQKDVPDYFPSWIRTKKVPKKEGTVLHALCNNAASLVYLADQACITYHPWLSRADRLEYPDRMIFDLDPGGGDFDRVREAAFLLHDFLGELELEAFVMTTGSRGLHVVVPLLRKKKFDEVRGLARQIAGSLAERYADKLTVEQSIKKRQGRLYLDTNRNAYAQTAVAPYSVRARKEAPVSAPLHWHELEKNSLTPRSFTVANIFRRLGQTEDPWRGLRRSQQGLASAAKILRRRA